MPFFFLFGDYQGSAQLMMSNEADPSAATIQRNAYTPYGSQRALNTDLSDDSPDVTFDDALSIERGWLSQVADEATTNRGTCSATQIPVFFTTRRSTPSGRSRYCGLHRSNVTLLAVSKVVSDLQTRQKVE